MIHGWGVHTTSVRGVRKGVIVVAIAVFFVGWVVVLPPAAANGSFLTYDVGAHRFTVAPTGIDDTANIQAAFDGCAADGSRCTVQLTSGAFFTAQIVVRNFQGNFQGMGESKTTVQALPNLPVSKDFPFNLRLPSPDNPWPNLFTFFDGTYSISGMTFKEPYAKPMQSYRALDLPGKIDALYAFVSVTGLQANVSVDHVTMIGGPGDFTVLSPFLFNVVNGIFPQALLLEPGSTVTFGKPRKGPVGDLLPLEVNFRITDSSFYTINGPIDFEDLVDSTATVSRNLFDTVEWGFIQIYMSNSTTTVSQNIAQNVLGHWAVEAYNSGSFSALIGCERPSQITIAGNDFEIPGPGGGVLVLDFAFATGCDPSLDVVIMGNTIRLGPTSYPGIDAFMMRSAVISGNTVLGPGPFGVYVQGGTASVEANAIFNSIVGVQVEGATGVLVRGNQVVDSGQWGIAVVTGLGLPPNNNLIEQNTVTGSGRFDLYWDGTGSGNVWTGNVFQTEYPPGLST